eukprot:5204188-Pleurochrysis_carterae.AAC.1
MSARLHVLFGSHSHGSLLALAGLHVPALLRVHFGSHPRSVLHARADSRPPSHFRLHAALLLHAFLFPPPSSQLHGSAYSYPGLHTSTALRRPVILPARAGRRSHPNLLLHTGPLPSAVLPVPATSLRPRLRPLPRIATTLPVRLRVHTDMVMSLDLPVHFDLPTASPNLRLPCILLALALLCAYPLLCSRASLLASSDVWVRVLSFPFTILLSCTGLHLRPHLFFVLPPRAKLSPPPSLQNHHPVSTRFVLQPWYPPFVLYMLANSHPQVNPLPFFIMHILPNSLCCAR